MSRVLQAPYQAVASWWTGAHIAIVVGGVVAVCAIGFAFYYFMIAKR